MDAGPDVGEAAFAAGEDDGPDGRPGGDGGTRGAGRPFRYHGGELGTEDLLRDPRSIT